MPNTGKDFEESFKKSVPDYCLLQRLPDPPQSFVNNKLTKFSVKNPCDFFMFDSNACVLYCLELKTTKYKTMTFEDIGAVEQPKKMIHKHQILALTRFSKYNGVIAGFILNFRDDATNIERTYFFNIIDFNRMYNNINKKSFNEIDIILYGAVKIESIKKRVHFTLDIDKFLSTYKGCKN